MVEDTPAGAGPGSDLLERLADSAPDAPVRLGRYDVVGRLGMGGMGTVYDAVDRERGIRVALKTLSLADAAAGVRLKREFRAVADVAHPNLAPVFELASEAGLWFFTMAHVDGVSFTRWARGPSSTHLATRPLPLTRAPDELMFSTRAPTQSTTTRVVTRQPSLEDAPPTPPTVPYDAIRAALAELIRGLVALHDAGVWHGDIKPDNVLVRGDGHVVVVDFGLAEPVGSARDGRGPTAGTPDFMSPEQLAGTAVGPASDWYSVGTMLYQVLVGRLPHDGDSLLDLYFKKTHETPPSPDELVPEVPADLADVCMALMHPVADRRPTGPELLRLVDGDQETRRRLIDRTVRSPFVGRRRELRVLEQAYGLARLGQRVVVHAHGPSGIGKSAMLRSFNLGVRAVDGALVLHGRCYERESVPYKAFDGIVDELAAHLARLDPARLARVLPERIGELAQVFPALVAVPSVAAAVAAVEPALEAVEHRRRAWAALQALVEAVAVEHLLVLSIDDLQWADADSARLLAALVRERGRARLLVVVSYRADDAAANPALTDYFAECAQLTEERHVVELPIGPLPRLEAERLARAVLRELGGHGDDARLRFLVEEAEGVPFFIEELARYVAATPAAALDGAVTLDDAITARLGALPAEQRALIEVVAVAGAPVPQSLLFEAAGLDAAALPALLALRSLSLIGWRGAGADDPVATYHDRIREAVVARLDDDARTTHHLALGRALVARHADAPAGAWVFEAVRHLHAAAGRLDRDERRRVAALALDAGRLARGAAAFPLAFACFERGIALLAADARDAAYDLWLGLHAGAAEAAYLAGEWDALATRCADVKAGARTVLDQLVAWEVEIDARVGRREYGAAVDGGMAALRLLGVDLPADPGAAEVGAAFERALAALTAVGPEGLAAMPDVSDPTIAAATRLQVRLAPAAYFARPMLLPVIACNLIQTSIARGLSTATPYALALFGIVLNTVGMLPTAHAWGQLALSLIERWPDRRLETATRHVVYNLVCPWMVPLASTLPPLRETWTIGRRSGDLEYGAYAIHGYVHSSIYAGRPLGPLCDEALAVGAEMRALGEVNAVHVHAPFERLLQALTGRLPGAPSLDGPDFSAAAELEASARQGSRSGVFVLRIAMGLAHAYLGEAGDAAHHLEIARDHLDAAPSVWHVPILHQFAALAACRLLDDVGDDAATRAALRGRVDASLAALRALAGHAPVNFAHRVGLVEAELRRLDGDLAGARAGFAAARAQADAGGWINDVALAHELEARCHPDDPAAARRALSAARDAYAAWGAVAKVARLDARLAAT
ncbi:MAG: AAA family ATPase [Kofleriaceae bacterium]|nr:AAA family ATPase [Kofleriaceae bacterium]